MLFIVALLACGTGQPVSGVVHHDATGSSVFLADNPTALIVDVRTPREFAAGHLEGAINIDFLGPDFASRVSELPKDKPLLVHCQVGGRSRESLPAFAKAGLTNVHHMDGGFRAWSGGGLPVTK